MKQKNGSAPVNSEKYFEERIEPILHRLQEECLGADMGLLVVVDISSIESGGKLRGANIKLLQDFYPARCPPMKIAAAIFDGSLSPGEIVDGLAYIQDRFDVDDKPSRH